MKPWLLLAAGLFIAFGLPPMPAVTLPTWRTEAPAAPKPATAAVYVYEKDAGAVPVGVTTAMNRLNRERMILATAFEADTTDGGGDVPEQYRVPLAAAKSAGLPALVVVSGSAVLRVVPAPATEAAVMEAVP